MIIEIGTTKGYAADLLSVKIIKSLVTIIMEDTFDNSGLPEKVYLNEISILTGGKRMADTLHSARNADDSKKHIYIVTESGTDARAMEKALLFWAQNPKQLQDAMKQINPDFNSFCWQDGYFEIIAADIADVLAASTLILPEDVPNKCFFRGSTSWTES